MSTPRWLNVQTGSVPPDRCIILTIDVSLSMVEPYGTSTKLDAAADAALEFARGALSFGRARVGVVTFSGTGTVLLRPETHYDAIESAVRRMYTSDTGTNFAAGLGHAMRQLSGAVGGEVVFLSDGHHNWERDPMRRATRIKAAGHTIDTVGIGTAPGDVDEVRLSQIASLDRFGRPRYRFIRDRATLLEHFESLGTGMRE